MIRALFVGVALTVAAPWAAPARAAEGSELTLESLMEGMASARGVVAEFREVKKLRLLRSPLESRGQLDFIPPDRLVRRTHEPAEATLWIDGSRVSFQDTAGAEPADLSGDPSAREFIDNFVVIFSGDLPELQRRYETRFTASGSSWSLELEPRDALVRRFVARISLVGEGRGLREMVLLESDGDVTTTTFERVETDHLHSEEELRNLFAGADTPEVPAP